MSTAPTRLVVFGATGGTGREVVRAAVGRGVPVTVLARRPGAVRVRDGEPTVRFGDVLRPADLDGLLDSTTVVVSALGIGMSRAATTVYSAGTANVVAAMRAAGARRLVCVSTSALEVGAAASVPQRLLTRQVLHRVLRRPYADMRRMEQVVRSSGVDWTLVRAARLVDGPGTGRYRVGPAGSLRGAWSISRADLGAHLVAAALEDGGTDRVVDLAH